MPSAGPNGEVSATIHQVNQDGAGPYKFEVSPSGEGGDWVEMTVQQNVPGRFLGLSRAVATPFPVEATIPAGTECTGGADGQTCVIRAKNRAPAGPFGSCFAVTQNQDTAQRVVKRMGIHSNWLIRKVGGITVESFTKV
ncbi:hypothetical protein BDY24DRAFT_412983 [Mrakia frigida]|uniref:DUF3129 domain-containing protein n=1 Tax=Mrakia frigida TaxID=29902 RepID=UPI003FCC1426